MMEYWNIGLKYNFIFLALFHHSTIPLSQSYPKTSPAEFHTLLT